MKPKTEVIRHRVDHHRAAPNVTPLYQCSSFLSSSEYFYTRKSNPNSEELEQAFAKLESFSPSHPIFCTTVSTGMAAISAVLSLLRPGDELVINELIYGCSYAFFHNFCEHYGIRLKVLDLSLPDVWRTQMTSSTKMVFFETPTNPLLKTVSIRDVRALCKERNPDCLVVVDNTWATPLFQNALALGADICVYSATKYFAGHSDCMGGFITTYDESLNEQMRQYRFYAGSVLDPHSCWLIRRSLQTFFIRMREHVTGLEEISSFLGELPHVQVVYRPEIDGQQLTNYGGILFFELAAEYEPYVGEFMDSLELFDRGTSLACVASAVAQPWSGSHLSLSEDQKKRMGITKRLLRLSIGLEDIDDLKTDLRRAFDALEQKRRREL